MLTKTVKRYFHKHVPVYIKIKCLKVHHVLKKNYIP